MDIDRDLVKFFYGIWLTICIKYFLYPSNFNDKLYFDQIVLK